MCTFMTGYFYVEFQAQNRMTPDKLRHFYINRFFFQSFNSISFKPCTKAHFTLFFKLQKLHDNIRGCSRHKLKNSSHRGLLHFPLMKKLENLG